MLESQEPKYRVDAAGRIVNRQSGEAIPDDEPVMIFRARDKNAAPMIAYYRKLCSDPLHKEIVGKRLHHFIDFLHDFPERMKEPDSQLDNQGITLTKGHAKIGQVSALKEGELVVRKKFTDAEMLDYLERHHTLHKKIDLLNVVDGYEAVVTWDDEPMSPTFKGSSLREALEEMMQGGDIITGSGQ